MSKITKGLENIHSVIDRHEAEWLKEQEESKLEQAVRKRLRGDGDSESGTPKGRFSANRFLGVNEPQPQEENEIIHEQEPEATVEPAELRTVEPEPELESQIEETEDEGFEGGVEAVSVIKQNDENKNHSWLYNEVLRAVNDAVGDSKNVKVVAVFVPVVQNGREFEDLPADSFVTTQPVNEEDVKVELGDILNAEPENQTQEQEQEEEIHEEVSEDFNLLPEGQDEPDAELAVAFQTMEEKLDETLQEEREEQESELPELEESEPEIPQHEIETLHLAKAKDPEISEENPDLESDSDSNSEIESEELLIEESEPEESEPEVELESEPEPEEKTEEENSLPPLPDELEDDEVFDDSQFRSPEEAIQMLEEVDDDDEEPDPENDESISTAVDDDDDDDDFTIEDAIGLIESDGIEEEIEEIRPQNNNQ